MRVIDKAGLKSNPTTVIVPKKTTPTGDSTPPAKPSIVANNDGSITIKPKSADTAKIVVSYFNSAGQKKTATAKSGNRWSSNDPAVKVNASTGEISIAADKVKDSSTVSAQAADDVPNFTQPVSVKAKAADSDGDGLIDALDPNNDSDGDGYGNKDETKAGSDPEYPKSTPVDTDGDGISNATDPDPDPDPDGDGLNDGDEKKAGTDPHNKDTDADGVNDKIEVGSNPSKPKDENNDGKIDALEPTNDSDGDGFNNADEKEAKTDPLDPLSKPGGNVGGNSNILFRSSFEAGEAK